MLATLILLRHGQSIWNKENIFTGWVDVGLSEHGEQEAKRASELLKKFHFDAVFCSALTRAITTAHIVLGENKPNIFICNEALNERHYGELQGKNKDECRDIYGIEKIESWRRSYHDRPNNGESLKDTYDRVIPFFEKEIMPHIMTGKTILISAHGNSLRALIKKLENLSDEDIMHVEVLTAIPIVYKLDNQGNIKSKMILSN